MMKLFRAAIALLTLTLGTLAPSRAEAAPNRNVLVIVSDDHGLELGCYGHRAIKTPNLDALAADATLFTNAFATVASCSASRSVIMTGLFNHMNGQFGHQHAHHDQNTHRWVKGISKILAEADPSYRCGLIGKNHVQPRDVYPWEFQPSPTREERQGVPANRNMAWIARKSGEFFNRGDSRPFFLLVGYSDPHRAGVDGFANELDYAGIDKIEFSPDDVIVPSYLPDWPETRAQLAEYYQSVARLDQGVGLVLKELKASGHYDDTLIVYLSDNGPAFIGAKTTLYDAGLHLPLIVRSPLQSKRGIRNDAMVSWVDLLPTILDWAEVPWDEERDGYALAGRSFLPTIDQDHAEGWDEIFASHVFHEVQMYYPMRAIRTRRYKLILNIAHPLPYPFATDLHGSPTWQRVLEKRETNLGGRTVADFVQRPRWELYDVGEDPGEFVNLAGDPAHRETLTRLQERLKSFQKRTRDPWLLKYEYE